MKHNSGQILIVDDNEEFLIALKIMLSPHFSSIVTEPVPDRILSHLKSTKYDVILLDMNFRAGIQSGNEGFYWMQKIREVDEDTTILFITAYGDVDLAIRSLKEGATDFIQKSWDENKIISTVLSAYKLSQKNREIRKLKNKHDQLSQSLGKDYHLIKGSSGSMEFIYDIIGKVSPTEASILITGESGTGKEVIAREIHRLSARSEELFVAVDLGAIQENLFESELFGHKKGSFTDAQSDRAGRIEVASGGTLFLDEIGNLPLNLQPKLLSCLQNKTIMRIGENFERKVDFRLISATNYSIEDMIKSGSFREDLLYRLKTVEIKLPALRQRHEDIPVLAGHFLNIYSTKYNKKDLTFSEQTINRLLKYKWPGNIRELQHAVEKAVILSNGLNLQPDDFQLESRVKTRGQKEKDFNLEKNEKDIIQNALTTFEWNMSKTAKELGINRSTLYEKIKKYELKPV